MLSQSAGVFDVCFGEQTRVLVLPWREPSWLSFEVIDPLNLRLDYEIKPQLMDISTETLVS